MRSSEQISVGALAIKLTAFGWSFLFALDVVVGYPICANEYRTASFCVKVKRDLGPRLINRILSSHLIIKFVERDFEL
jgi:hypothetical protein